MRNVKNLALFVLMLALLSTAAVAEIHYVLPGKNIQAAIDVAHDGDEVWVMPGYYNEVIDFGGKAIRLYGGGGPDLTIIDGMGAPGVTVVRCTNDEGPDTILEGFTITGGNGAIYGGGMYNLNSSPTVTNCTFTGNHVNEKGGGMYNKNSSPTVTNCTLTDNTAFYDGGGMHNENSNPTVTNCTFTNNTTNTGGGMYNYSSNPMVTDCTFTGNTANEKAGGGMYNEFSILTVTNCTFTNNTANSGGGMYNRKIASMTVTNCTFTGNTANYGGGMSNFLDSSPTVTNCTFTGNIAIDGGGMHNEEYSSPTVTNCVLWGDSPDEIFDEPDSSTTVTYSDVQGGWPGTGNIDADPLFADTEGRLLDGSPCIDAGNDAAVPPSVITDLDGNPRIQGVCVDMGAFESEFAAPDFSGWVWMDSGGDFGYSYDEDDLLYFLSFGPVWYYNTATSQWGEEGPAGWTHVNWPFMYESATDTLMFALPPEDGLWVYHFRFSQWTVSPRIIP